MLRYPRIGLTAKSGLEDREGAVSSILAILHEAGATVLLDPARFDRGGSPSSFYRAGTDIDLLVVLGGDGTILRAVRELADFRVPILSINRGIIGFLAEIDLAEASTILPRLLEGDGVLEERSVLHVQAKRHEGILFQGYALNEAVIAQGSIARLVDLATAINGEPLVVYRADGLIVSTPTGSTAYSLAAGGPIVHPALQATILTPINPYSFSQKPVVVPSSADVLVEVLAKSGRFQDIEVILTLDGQISTPLQSGDAVSICGCEHTVKFLRRRQDTFFHTLRAKLKWGERVEGASGGE
jgi:NAD+ kinase